MNGTSSLPEIKLEKRTMMQKSASISQPTGAIKPNNIRDMAIENFTQEDNKTPQITVSAKEYDKLTN